MKSPPSTAYMESHQTHRRLHVYRRTKIVGVPTNVLSPWIVA